MAWMDLEMTGLDPSVDRIVEIATIITDDELNVIAEGPDIVIHQPDDVLAKMPPIVVDMHTKSGLLEEIRTSTVT
ncbi:MAG: exonuclease domain-containing protein, partial [Actinomycetota bacterium]